MAANPSAREADFGMQKAYQPGEAGELWVLRLCLTEEES